MRSRETKTLFKNILFVSLVMICGVGFAMVHGTIVYPDPRPLGATELHVKYLIYSQTFFPHLERIFVCSRLTVSNIGVAFIILVFPLYWLWIAKYSGKILSPENVPMKATVYFLILAVGHNTFFRSYLAMKTLPMPVFLTMYYPHALIEILAYILAGTFSLLCIDEVRDYFSMHRSLPDLNPGDLSLVIFRRIWYVFIIIGLLLIAAGAIECYVTPRLVLEMMEIFY